MNIDTSPTPDHHSVAMFRIGGQARLGTGQRLTLRPVQPDDAPLLKDFFARLSPGARRLRFHAAVGQVSEAWLRYMTCVDFERQVALVATMTVDGTRHIVGEARYVRDDDDGHAAEFAVAVAESLRGLGLGRLLLQELQEAATRAGVHRLHGAVLPENDGMRRLAARSGFVDAGHGDDGAVIVQRRLEPGPAPGRLAVHWTRWLARLVGPAAIAHPR